MLYKTEKASKGTQLSALTATYTTWLQQKDRRTQGFKVSGQYVQFGLDPISVAIRESAAALIRHLRGIADNVRRHAPFYLGEEDAEVPGEQDLIEFQVDPMKSGGCSRFNDFCRAVTNRYPGQYNEAEREAIELLKMTFKDVIKKALEPVLRTEALNASSTVVSDFFGYLRRPNPTLTLSQHEANVTKHNERLQKRFCRIADAFYNRTTELLAAAKQKAEAAKPKRKPRAKMPLGMGRQTPFMKEQRRIFEAFLRDNPVTGSYSVITRANQCWLRHKEEWDAAAADGTGYSCHKALARAV